MNPRIETIDNKKVVGLRINTCVAKPIETIEMWSKFMPQRNKISNRSNNQYLSIQVMDPQLKLEVFTENTMFEKWAAVEVSNHDDNLVGLESYTISGGKFAVFTHHGPAQNFGQTMHKFFTEWLPSSGFQFDPERPRFEILEEDYVPTNQEAEEEVWMPIL